MTTDSITIINQESMLLYTISSATAAQFNLRNCQSLSPSEIAEILLADSSNRIAECDLLISISQINHSLDDKETSL